MTYTIEDELQAQAKLAQIYQTLDRRGRLRLADRLGYRRGSEENRLRQVRRITRSTVEPGKFSNVTSYFRDYVATSDAPEPLEVRSDAWKGVVPPITIKGKVQLLSQIMYVARTKDDERGQSTIIAFEAQRNTTRETDKTDLRALFEDYNNQIKRVLGEYQRATNGETVTIEAIAFSRKGVTEIVEAYQGRVEDPNPSRKYGIALVSTRAKYNKKGKRLDSTPTASADRRIPRQRRDEIIRYANRAYGQYSRPGGKLA